MFGACRVGGETPPGQPPRRQRSVVRAILAYVRPIKIIVEKHDDGYVGYPIGMRGVVVGEAIPTTKHWPMFAQPFGVTSRRSALMRC
jgi:hypothetical protein